VVRVIAVRSESSDGLKGKAYRMPVRRSMQLTRSSSTRKAQGRGSPDYGRMGTRLEFRTK
jgi:hypothetical protein